MPKPSSKPKNNQKVKKNQSKSPFKSFQRGYREDFQDNFKAPGLLSHSMTTFAKIFKNWKFFGGLLLIAVISSILIIGLMNQDYIINIKSIINSSASNFTGNNGNLSNFAQAGLLLIATATTGGLNQDISDGQGIFLVLIFLLIWLATIYFLRYLLAHKKVSLRDSLYNAFTPLASTFVIFLTILLELIPVFLTIIFYKSALETDFLSTPFYALLFIGFALLMLTISGYLISSSIIALVAVSAPGFYPLPALRSTHELMFGRRIKFIIRLLFLFLVIGLIFVITMLPVILLDNLLKSHIDIFANIPVISFMLLVVTCFSFIYSTTYIYLYYRKMLENEQK